MVKQTQQSGYKPFLCKFCSHRKVWGATLRLPSRYVCGFSSNTWPHKHFWTHTYIQENPKYFIIDVMAWNDKQNNNKGSLGSIFQIYLNSTKLLDGTWRRQKRRRWLQWCCYVVLCYVMLCWVISKWAIGDDGHFGGIDNRRFKLFLCFLICILWICRTIS